MSNSLWPHGLYSPWHCPGQNTGVGSLTLLQGILPTQGLNPGLPHCRLILYQLSHKGSPRILKPIPSPAGVPDPGIESGSPELQVDSLSTEPRQHIKKQRYYFPNKGLSSQSCGFSSSHVWMWELDYKEGWTSKNWCFWTVVLEKTRVPWTARRSNILKEISPDYSLEGLMLKLKLQYFGHLMGRTDSLEKTLVLGKIEGMRRSGQQRMRWLDGITDSMDMSLSKLCELVIRQGRLVCCSPWDRKESNTFEELN